MTNDPDKTLADSARALRTLQSQWLYRKELIAYEAKVTKARFDALRAEGFDYVAALALCTKRVEL